MCLLSVFCTFVQKVYLLYLLMTELNIPIVHILHVLSIQSSGDSINSNESYNFPTLDIQNIARWSLLQIFD